ncbi:hypothetical protein M1403_00190 [Patescibacteria group bacterium]|nr:hypothetical protein [Patescibacteria group bacterium]
MKKLASLLFLIFLSYILFSRSALAATATPSPSATSSARSQEIQDQVNKLVNKLSGDLKRTYTGKIKSVGAASIVISTTEGDRTITTNEVTSLYRITAGKRAEITFSNLKDGDDLAAFGTIDPGNMEMTARQIIVKIHRYNLVGTIKTNEKNVLTVKEFGGPETKVDLTGAILKKNLGTIFSAAKLADFKPGSTVMVLAYTDPSSPVLSTLKADILSL